MTYEIRASFALSVPVVEFKEHCIEHDVAPDQDQLTSFMIQRFVTESDLESRVNIEYVHSESQRPVVTTIYPSLAGEARHWPHVTETRIGTGGDQSRLGR